MPYESRLNFSFDEILANPNYKEPLIVNGIKCHGGFDADGRYLSPRTTWRVPAIRAWQEQHLAASREPLVEIASDAVPPHCPNVEQSKLLLKEGVREPLVRILSEIAIVEGFGAMIRELPVPPLGGFIRENVEGTALAHLEQGLFEAHARDEAGWAEEGGHRQMWDAARDAALSNPPISPEIYAEVTARRGGQPPALFPELGEPVERLIRFMVNVLAIEVFAASTFAWAEAVLSDPAVSDEPDKAGGLIRYIRSDESPHVEYLRTGLSEIAARTLITLDGREVPGRRVVDTLMQRSVSVMIRQRLTERPLWVRDLIRRSAKGRDIDELLGRYDALAEPWTPPVRFAGPTTEQSAMRSGY